MPVLQTLYSNNDSSGELEVSGALLDTPYNAGIINDAVVAFRAGIRQGTHSAKGRSEIAGSTRKLWKQKGTGRARVGSAKSPIMRHGGIVFGPTPRSHATKLNRKVRKKALRSAVAQKIRQNELFIIESLDLDTHKTKPFKATLDGLNCNKVLLVVDQVSENLALASRNLQDVHVLSYRSLNVYELLRFPKVLLVKDAFSALEQRLLS